MIIFTVTSTGSVQVFRSALKIMPNTKIETHFRIKLKRKILI